MKLLGISTWIIAMAVAWSMTPLIIRLASKLNAIDQPNARKSHDAPMPRIGGLAVYAGFVVALAFAAFVSGVAFSVPENAVYWRGLAIAGTGMLLIGLIDDLVGLRFYWKFAAQITAAIYVWNCGFAIDVISRPIGGGWELGMLSFPLTVLWIVGITNAVNLIDGLDGLATGTALITTMTVAAIAFYRGELGVTAASVALSGALMGFLRYNFNPARIFLGDSGSMFLGFVLAVISVRGSQKGPTVVAILVPLLVLGLPLMDTGMAVIRRLYRINSGAADQSRVRHMAKNFHQVFLPDRAHIHHRLMDAGLSHRSSVLLLYGIGVAFAIAAFVLVMVKSLWVGFLLFTVLMLSMVGFLTYLYVRLDSAEALELAEGQSADGASTDTISSNLPVQPKTATSGATRRR